jgi:uncharacterized membrane protein
METPQHDPIETPISNQAIVSEGKTIAIIAYITFIGLIIAFVLNMEKKNSFAMFHIRQSLGLVLTALILGIVNIIPVLGWLISIIGSIVIIVMWILALISALNGTKKPVFLLGEKFQEWFRDI